MRRTLEYLEQVNPSCIQVPDKDQRLDFRLARLQLLRRLSDEFSAPFVISDEGDIQDSNHCDELYFPDQLILGEAVVVPAIRFSIHEKLFVITVARRVLEQTQHRIEELAEELGFTYTPEEMFGEPFDKRVRFNGDLFNQLYDYY